MPIEGVCAPIPVIPHFRRFILGYDGVSAGRRGIGEAGMLYTHVARCRVDLAEDRVLSAGFVSISLFSPTL